jgi:hypothetical protein
MLNYLGEVERSTGELRRENEQLRATLQQLNTKMSGDPDEREELEKEMMKYHE